MWRLGLDRWWILPLVVMSGILVALTFPVLASACHLEAGGRAIQKPELSASDLERTREHLNKAIEWDANNAQAYRLLGKVYRQQGDWSAATEALTRYTELRPGNPLGHIELAEAYEALETQRAATEGQILSVRIVEEWRRAGFTAESLVTIGKMRQSAGHDEEAGLWYERALRFVPESAEVRQLLAETPRSDTTVANYLEAEGLDALEKAMLLRPSDLYVTYQLWKEAQQAGDLSNAAAYGKVLSSFPLRAIHPADDRLVSYAAEVAPVLLEEGLWDRERILNVTAFWVWQHPQASGLESLLARLEERFLNEADWPFYLGELYYRQGNLEQAEAMYRHALQVDPGYTRAYLRLGMVATAGCDPEIEACMESLAKAADAFGEYHALVPTDLAALKRLAEVCAGLEEGGVENAACRGASERVNAEVRNRSSQENLGSPATALWAGWRRQAAVAEPKYPVGQEYGEGWTFLGYDADEERLIRGEGVDILLYWTGPDAGSAGSEQDGWYPAGERWVQVIEDTHTLVPNGGFELGLAGFPHDIYGADPGTRRLTNDCIGTRCTTVALLENDESNPNTSFASVEIPIKPNGLYLQAGWIKSVDGNGYLGRYWAGDITSDARPYDYVAEVVRNDAWRHYAGLTKPLEGAARSQIWLLNYQSEGQVYFDNILLMEIGWPGRQ